MIPFYPENTKQLQQQGILDLGLRMLQASGPQHPGMGFGARLGGAGLGTMQAMRGAGQDMQQTQMMKQKAAQAAEQSALQSRASSSLTQQAMQYGPLGSEKSAALDMALANINAGENPTSESMRLLMPGTTRASTAKFTKSDRVAQLAKRVSLNKATKAEMDELDILIRSDPLDQLRRQIMKNYGGGGQGNDPIGIR